MSDSAPDRTWLDAVHAMTKESGFAIIEKDGISYYVEVERMTTSDRYDD